MICKMRWKKFQQELKRRNIRGGSYIEITLNKGEIFSGKYAPLDREEIKIFVHGREEDQYCPISSIISVAKLPLRREDIPKHLEETLKEFEEWDFS